MGREEGWGEGKERREGCSGKSEEKKCGLGLFVRSVVLSFCLSVWGGESRGDLFKL